MKLFARLMFFGAAVPTLAAAGIFGAAVWGVKGSLEQELDRALLAQAAVEAVSLFDGPEGGVHLHMKSSPLLDAVRPFAPEAGVYDARGAKLMSYPEHAALPDALGALPAARTLEWTQNDRRRVVVPVSDPQRGARYALVLEARRDRIDAEVARVLRGGGGAVLLLGGVLSVLAGVWGSRLTRRVRALEAHMERVRNGELDVEPARDASGDEVAALRDAVAEATRELRAARQARERFIADAAHELRTPLASMRVALDLALRRPRTEAELKEALQQTRDETDRLTTLAQRLLDVSVSASAPLERAPLDVGALAEEMIAAQAARAAEQRVRVVRDGSASEVWADRAALRRALDNLLDNALKHAPAHSTVTVALADEAGSVRVVVRDEGPGIPAAERAHVFEAFHRVRQDRPGHGLGLALVREVARRHGGEAFVEDGPGGRVGFTIRREPTRPSA